MATSCCKTLMAGPLGTLSMGPAVSTIEVGDDVDGGSPGGRCRQVRQCPPPRLKMTSMVDPL
jgi:hypothetical protein